MRSYSHILAAIDPSDGSAPSVLDAAETLQCAQNVKLTVASSFIRPPVGLVPHSGMGGADTPIDPAPYSNHLAIDVEQEAKKYEKAVHDAVENAGLDADIRIPHGGPGGTIPELAEELGADLVIVGSHDRGFIESAIMGSVSKTIAKKAPCDVLLVSPPSN